MADEPSRSEDEDVERSTDDRHQRLFDPLGIVKRDRSDEDKVKGADIAELTDHHPVAFGVAMSVRQLWRRWRRVASWAGSSKASIARRRWSQLRSWPG